MLKQVPQLAKKARVYDGTAWQELASAQTDLTAYSTTAEISSTYATKVDFPEGAWQSWAPTLSGGWANGNGVWTAKYAQLGKIVFVSGSFTLGSTTTKGTSLTVSLPVNFQSTGQHVNASVRLNATSSFIGHATANAANAIQLWAQNASGTYLTRSTITATIPATWVTGNSFSFNMSYEGV